MLNGLKKRELFGIKLDIVQIDNAICELDSKINEMVFGVYNLNQNRVKLVWLFSPVSLENIEVG